MMRPRKKVGLIALAPTALATVVAVKLIALTIVSGQVSAAYEREDFESATSMARWLTVVNVIDPWKAHLAVGDGLAGQGLNADAQKEFERALSLASARDQCPVRVNLSLVFERQGDAIIAADATKRDEASAFYDEALDVIAKADKSCQQPPAKGEKGTDKELSDSEKRVTEKKKALADQQPEDKKDTDDKKPAPDNSPSDATVDQLEEQLRDAGKSRSGEQTADRSPSDSDYVDKPW